MYNPQSIVVVAKGSNKNSNIPEKWETSPRESYGAKVSRPPILPSPLAPSPPSGSKRDATILLSVHSKVNFFTRCLKGARETSPRSHDSVPRMEVAPVCFHAGSYIILFMPGRGGWDQFPYAKRDVEPRFPAGWPRVDTIRAWTGEVGNSWQVWASCLVAIII